MAKITYLLGAGASFNSCPILNKQAEAMIFVANYDLITKGSSTSGFYFNDLKELDLISGNKNSILWRIGYFGKKALEFGTIDTYAKKLHLQKAKRELNLLKMSVSVFFDLWENFYETRYWNFEAKYIERRTDGVPVPTKAYEKIDKRYISLFSIFLERNQEVIKMSKNVNFITWNYDLQLEQTFKLFAGDRQCKNIDDVNNCFPYQKGRSSKVKNKVFHLNGHRGYYDYDKVSEGNRTRQGTVDTIQKENYEEFWKLHLDLYVEVERRNASYDKYINYAWEQELSDAFFEDISNVLKETEILIIIGYSFPLFNRLVDEFLLDQIGESNIREIVYQDPNASMEMLNTVFQNENLENMHRGPKITIRKETNQFYIPNNYNKEYPEKEIYI